MNKILLISILFMLGSVSCLKAQRGDAEEPTRILFLVDASASMKKIWDKRSRWEAAKQILTNLTDSLNALPHIEMGLRVYGHQTESSKRDCKDTRLEVTVAQGSAGYIRAKLNELRPRGITPIAYSLEKAANDFPATPGRNIVILITDGEESCRKDVCEVSRALQKSNAIMKPFIIGLDIPDFAAEKLECIGTLHRSAEPGDFEENLNRVMNRTLATTTLQVNLLDTYKKPTETNVNMTFHDSQTQIAKYNFYHTINRRGNPDTLIVDPVYDYDIAVHTIPPVYIAGVQLEENKHNVVDIEAPQGELRLEIEGRSLQHDVQKKIKCLVKRKNDYKTLHIQPFNSSEKYLVGSYDLELLTLPRIKMEGVQIEQSAERRVAIPAPGLLTLNKGYAVFGGLFMMEDNRLKKIYELKTDLAPDNIALQPGTYRLVYRSRLSKSMHTTIDKEIVIVSGESVVLKL